MGENVDQVRLFAILVVSASLVAGCTGSDPGASLKATDDLVTGSVIAANREHGVDPGDAEIIKSHVTASPVSSFTAPLKWKNGETGASGAILAIETYRGRHGQPCRSFRTSIASFGGVSLFEGETCETPRRSWILSWLRRFD